MKDDQIKALIRKHGAKNISDAAYAAMEGKPARIKNMGVSNINLPLAYKITTLAYPMMREEDKAADYTNAVIQGAKITSKFKGGKIKQKKTSCW